MSIPAIEYTNSSSGKSRGMELAPALLEDWMRDYYFSTEIDIGSSGVENFSMADLRNLLNLKPEDLDSVTFNDSPSCGEQKLREAIAARWGNGDAEQVMVASGSSEIIFLVMNALLREGDEVVVHEPCYHALRNLADSIGCYLKVWPLSPVRHFAPDIQEVKRLITPRTRMVIANFPHNPTGVSLSEADFEELIKAVDAVGAYLIWDSAFAELTYDRPPLPNPVHRYKRAITIGTLSKAYGLAGLRVGWSISPAELLAEFVHWRDYTTLYLSPLVEAIALRAVEQADTLLEMRFKRARTNLDVLEKWAGEHKEFLEWARPQGGVTAFPRLHNVRDVEAFCRRLASERKTLVVPGNCFGHPSHVRIGFGGPTEELHEGLARLSGLLKDPSVH